jgi:TonB family protein
MPLSSLRTVLSSLLETRPGKHIFIKPSRDRSYGDVIAVMDEIKGAGAEPIFLLIDEVEVPRKIPNAGRPPALQSDALPGGGGVASGVVGGVPGGVPDVLPRIIRKSGVALRDSATQRVEPKTPPLARAAKVTGAVVVEVIVGEQGEVISARAVSGHPLLKDAAVDAARGWRFTPTRLSGEPIKVIGTLTFTFKE